MNHAAAASTRLKPDDQQIVREVVRAADQHLGLRVRDVQLAAGIELLTRTIVEMPTGEGKTLTTVVPAAIMARRNRRRQGNVLVATANDYLAERDATWMQPIYRDLGLQVGFVTSGSSDQQRQQAYQCDITYGTIRQFAFDFLRHSLALRQVTGDLPYQFDVLIVDEADSVLIDEARTPMIITSPSRDIDEAAEACYRFAAKLAGEFRVNEDFVRLSDGGAVALTGRGRGRAVKSSMPPAMASLSTTEILHALERAIWVNLAIHRDEHYVVRDGRIEIVDEYTGRKQAERAFGGGVHQAIEARESLELTPESLPVARLSVQDFVIKFGHVCGLTATAWEDRQELRSAYELNVKRQAPHAACQREVLAPVVCQSREDKWKRIIDETRGVSAAGRAVLIGTRTIERSEQLSGLFRREGIDHVVLNARNVKEEAAIVATAGRSGRITIATNMAGRGTDIQLDTDVARRGGLHVIVSELHAAARIDRQLMGRCGRGGDPGSARLYVSPDDEILAQAYGQERAARMAESRFGPRRLLAKLLRAQQRVSRQHRLERARLAALENHLAESLRLLGLDPHLDPLPERN